MNTPSAGRDDDDLARAFAEVSWDLVARATSLEELTALANAWVPHSEYAALTLIRGASQPETVASTGELPRRVDALQYETHEGPCLEAIVENDISRANDLAVDEQWPKFAARTIALTPIRAIFGVRLLLGEQSRAALNFYSCTPGSFTDLDLAVGAIFSSFASLILEREAAQKKAANLEVALESSRQIGTAMGILMARRLMTSEQAFEQLRMASQHLHRKLRDIAGVVLETGELPSE